MKRILTLLYVAMSLLWGLGNPGWARAQPQFPEALPAGPMEVISTRPAATLLLPYFEVELSKTSGITTVFSINNASATAVLAHVTVWSELSIPVLAFNVYLTGFDVQAINMRDILNGILPRTASDGQDPQDTISPQGDFSQDINFASCNGQLPPPPLDATYIIHLQNSLTGKSSPIFGGLCSAFDSGTRARGYVTVDTVNNCTLRVARDPGYFAPGGTGDVTNQNLLWGDFYFLNPSRVNGIAWISRGGPLVHIRADVNDPATSTPGNYTFYGRYVNWTAIDNRQPLGTTFAARYINGGAFQTPSSLIVWRDAKVNQQPVACPAILGARPNWTPLGQEGIAVFDEQENIDLPLPPPVFPPPPGGQAIPFRSEAQRVEVGGPDFPVAFDFGWSFLNLNTTVLGQVPGLTDPTAAQAWVYVIYDTTGRFNTGHDASVLDSALDANHTVPGM